MPGRRWSAGLEPGDPRLGLGDPRETIPGRQSGCSQEGWRGAWLALRLPQSKGVGIWG